MGPSATGSRWEATRAGSATWPASTSMTSTAPPRSSSSPTTAARQALLRAAIDRGDVLDFARQVPALSEIYREVTA